jgi:hypothetical protein
MVVADLAVQPRDLAERGQGVEFEQQQFDEELRRVDAVGHAVAGRQEHEAAFGCVLQVDEMRKT